MKSQKVRLGVNVDHVATLRQVRGGTTSYPDVLQMVKAAVKGGADQITIHLREDRRHIQDNDLKLLAKKCPVSLNLEMAATDEMCRKALLHKPDWVCLVPEKRQELTTEGGLDVAKGLARYKRVVRRLAAKEIPVTMFIEPSRKQVKASFEVGAKAVEFHTGRWVLLKGEKQSKEWKRLQSAARYADELGLQVHAGHGLDFESTRKIKRLSRLQEVNIGHSLVCYAVEMGLEKAVRKMKRVLG